jgi:hypothetical protein
LTEGLNIEKVFFDIDKSESRLANARAIWNLLGTRDWDLIYQEGTGIAAGIPLILASQLRNQRYVISSGDPIGGFFRTVKGPLTGFVLEQYERQLYRHSAGFIGWTPYLTGMALKMGAPRAVTVEGAVDTSMFTPYSPEKRRLMKEHYGLSPNHIVCGVVGSLTWTRRQQYCYGLELIEMLRYLDREDVSILIVGDGDGRPILQERVPEAWRSQVVFTGRLPEEEVADALNAMDIGFIAQTLDGLGSYRLTTKLPEYFATGLPVAMSPIPGYYDYARTAGWSLPASHPADPTFHRACAQWLETVQREDIHTRREKALSIAKRSFEYHVVRPKFNEFVIHTINSL